MDTALQKCTQCKAEKELDTFVGVNGKPVKRCRICREYASRYYVEDRKLNKAKYSKRQEIRRNNNLNRHRKIDREAKKKYRQEHYEEYSEQRRKYRKDNYEKMMAVDRARLIDRPEYFLFSSARARARKKNLEFTITESDIKQLLETTTECPLRKTEFTRGSDRKATDNSASIDRINSTEGYTKHNIQLISYRANVIKSNLTLELFLKIVKNFKKFKLIEHHIDDITRAIIIDDRHRMIVCQNRTGKDLARLINAERWLLASAKKRSNKNNLEMSIDVSYIKSIWPIDNKCPILKEKFVQGQMIMNDLSATIDRIDNSIGYVKGNVRIISAKANSVKNKATLEELEFMLKNWKNLERDRK